MQIPKKIHVSWKSKDILSKKCDIIEYGVKNMVKLNSSWSLEISDDNDVERYIYENLNYQDYLLLKNKHIVEKIDVWRLLKLIIEGGVYTDIDRLCDTPFSNMFKEHTKCVLLTNKDYDFSHDMMISAPQNPILYETLKLNLERRRQGHTHIYFLGPQTYMHGVTKVITGNQINTNPSDVIFNEIRKMINDIPFLETYREEPPLITLIHKNNNNFTVDDIESMKRQLYIEYNIKHWTGEW